MIIRILNVMIKITIIMTIQLVRYVCRATNELGEDMDMIMKILIIMIIIKNLSDMFVERQTSSAKI